MENGIGYFCECDSTSPSYKISVDPFVFMLPTTAVIVFVVCIPTLVTDTIATLILLLHPYCGIILYIEPHFTAVTSSAHHGPSGFSFSFIDSYTPIF